MTVQGKKIVEVRSMTSEELERVGWTKEYGVLVRYPPPVLVLEDGTRLFPSRDPEGNGPGAIFGINAEDFDVWIPPPDSPAAKSMEA